MIFWYINILYLAIFETVFPSRRCVSEYSNTRLSWEFFFIEHKPRKRFIVQVDFNDYYVASACPKSIGLVNRRDILAPREKVVGNDWKTFSILLKQIKIKHWIVNWNTKKRRINSIRIGETKNKLKLHTSSKPHFSHLKLI